MATNLDAQEATKIHLCTEMPTPQDRVIEAAIKAVEENPLNAPIHEVPGGMGINPRAPERMALLTENRWKPGRTLRVKFLDGVSAVREKVTKYAKEWEKYANIKLDFITSSEAEIRVAFSPGGSWSYLGTVALVIDPAEPTMNYGWLTPNSQE